MLIHIIIYSVLLLLFSSANSSNKPHVILIVADDLGWNDVGFHGSNQIPTPNIDMLAFSGVLLHNYYTLPICSPSRSALLTGIHPIHSGMYHRVIIAPEPWGMPLNLKILPQYLKEEGYRTHAVGKWHLGFFRSEYLPEKRGFDSHFGYWTGKQDYYNHTSDALNMCGYDMREGGTISWNSKGSYTTDLLTDKAIDIINKHDNSSPLFLYFAHLAVHSANHPAYLQAPADVIKKFNFIKDENRRIYAAMVWKLDEAVGKVVSTLGERNMLNNTIIVFTSDNGGAAAGFNYNAASNFPLRGVKDTLWEGGVRGAAFIWSSLLPKSKINNHLMHIQDWLPTILKATDYQKGKSAICRNDSKPMEIDGKDMWPVLQGTNQVSYDEIVLNIDPIRNISALRKGDWKIIQGDAYDGKWNDRYGPSGRDEHLHYDIDALNKSLVAKAFVKNKITLPLKEIVMELRKNTTVWCGVAKREVSCNLKLSTCLYNVKDDPCELRNIADKYPETLNKLQNILNTYKPVKDLNQSPDSRSDPKRWNNTWTNWMDYL